MATKDLTIDPARFGDPNALDVGETWGMGTLQRAGDAALATLAERGVDRVQFWFNGTPAVVQAGDSDTTIHRDWHARRTAYHEAAGII